mgnify:CR=1 FL=1|tara:strand:- start:118 stop:429 length:312 start_codon:yes stop_codon:yes gene_type:complete
MSNKDKEVTELKLDDSAIAQIAKILQMAILTGTDVVDNLRLMRLSIDGESLVPSENYVENFDSDVNHMVETLDDLDNEPTLATHGLSDVSVFNETTAKKEDIN